MATGAYYGNPNIQRQGEKARQIAQQRNVSDIADPRTYGFMQGLFGTAPDQLGYSVFDDPATKQAAQQAAEVGFVGGGLLSSLPIVGPALRGYGRLAAGQVNRAMMGEGGLLGPITPQPMYVVPPGKGVKPINLSKGIYKPDLTMEEMLKVRDIPTVDRVRQSIDLIGEKEFEKMVNAKYSQYKPSNPDQEAMLVESVTLDVLGRAQRSPYPQQAALDLAQQRAALPVEQGGLGLPATNTAADRAKVMGIDTDAYHSTNASDITKFDLGKSSRGEGTSVALTPENAQAYGNITYPLKVDQQKIFDPTNKDQLKELKSYVENLIQQQKPYDKDSLSFYPFTSKKVLENLANPETGAYYLENEIISKSLKDLGYSGSIGMESGQSQLKIFNPDQIRSRFAAFDPFRRNAAIATAMGVALPDLLAQPVNQYQPTYETIPMYTDPFGNTIGSSIR